MNEKIPASTDEKTTADGKPGLFARPRVVGAAIALGGLIVGFDVSCS